MKEHDARCFEALRRRIEADALTEEEREELEAKSDRLLDLIGLVERERPDSAAYDDPRFLAWLAKEGDEHELLDDATIRMTARRVVAALHGEQSQVRLVRGAVPEERVGISGPTSEMVEELTAGRRAAYLDLRVAAGAGRALWDAECESCVPLPDDVPSGRYLALRVDGESMVPLMCPGDVVLVRLGADIAPGSVIVARGLDDGYVVKRVGRVSKRQLELLSLNPAFAPMQVARRTNTVLGTVVLRWCDHAG